MGNRLFKEKIKIKLLKQEIIFDTVICHYYLEFDNKSYAEVSFGTCPEQKSMKLHS